LIVVCAYACIFSESLYGLLLEALVFALHVLIKPGLIDFQLSVCKSKLLFISFHYNILVGKLVMKPYHFKGQKRGVPIYVESTS